jgi:hypothetical protein
MGTYFESLNFTSLARIVYYFATSFREFCWDIFTVTLYTPVLELRFTNHIFFRTHEL